MDFWVGDESAFAIRRGATGATKSGGMAARAGLEPAT